MNEKSGKSFGLFWGCRKLLEQVRKVGFIFNINIFPKDYNQFFFYSQAVNFEEWKLLQKSTNINSLNALSPTARWGKIIISNYSLEILTFNAHEKNSSPPSNIPTILPNRESTPDFNNLNARQQAEVTAMRGIRDSYSKLLNEQKRNRRNDLLEARRVSQDQMRNFSVVMNQNIDC